MYIRVCVCVCVCVFTLNRQCGNNAPTIHPKLTKLPMAGMEYLFCHCWSHRPQILHTAVNALTTFQK